MHSQNAASATGTERAAVPWILEHLLAYPGTYEIPLRTMYSLNSVGQCQPPPSPSATPGNAFPRTQDAQLNDDSSTTSTNQAASQLRANLMNHITQQPYQPTSLPPSFITSFARRCFSHDLAHVDFPQALTALDYLKDLEVRRRNEVVGALDRLGISRADIGNRDDLAKKYPGVMKWIETVEGKERQVEALYTHVYLGLRRWTIINEMSLTPFNKSNCIAMLNTLYPPTALPTSSSQFVQPTAQLTSQVLTSQRNGYFRYITAVERNGSAVLTTLMDQKKRPGESSGWPRVRDDLDNYLRMANAIIDECYEITGRGRSPTSASFSSIEIDEESKRKVDSGISFDSGYSSNRSSGQSHLTRPSTSSSASNHSRQVSKDKQLDKTASSFTVEDDTITVKPAGSALERIARELRRIKSRSNVREESRVRPTTSHAAHASTDSTNDEEEIVTQTLSRGLRFKRSLRNMRSNNAMRDRSTSRPTSRNGSHGHIEDAPAFDAEEMRLRRQAWEDQQRLK